MKPSQAGHGIARRQSPRSDFRIRIVKPAHVSGVMRSPDSRRPLVSGPGARAAHGVTSTESCPTTWRPGGRRFVSATSPRELSAAGAASVAPAQCCCLAASRCG